MSAIEKNTILYTKDGRQFTNGIVTQVNGEMFEIKTDYGNTMTMTKMEVNRHFYTDKGLSEEEKIFMQESHKHGKYRFEDS